MSTRWPSGEPRRPALNLFLLLGVGILLRLLPLGYGSPEPGYFSADEIDSVSRALKMAEGDLLPLHASKPTLYVGAVTAGLGARYLWLRATEGLSVQGYADLFFLEPFPFYLIARLVSALAAIGTLLLLAWMVRRYSWPLRALVIGAMVIMPSSVYYGHLAKEDSLAAFLTFASFCLAWSALGRTRQEEGAGHGLLLASAFAAGLAISAKYNCFFAPLFSGLVWATLPEFRRRIWLAPALVFATLVAFVLGTPYALLHPMDFVRQTLASDIASQVAGAYNNIHYIENRGPVFLSRIIWAEWKLLLVPVVVCALLVVRQGRAVALAFLLPLALYATVLLLSGQLDYQYLLPMTAPLLLLAAEGAHREGLSLLHRARRTVTLVFLPMIALSLVLNANVLLSRTAAYALAEDPRHEAALFLMEYMAENPEATVRPLLFATPYYYHYWPAVRIDEESYLALLEETRTAGGAGGYFERAARIAAEHPADRLSVRFLAVRPGYLIRPDGSLDFEPQPFETNWEHHRARHDLVVVPHLTMAFARRPEPEVAAFRRMLEALQEEEMLAEFEPVLWGRRLDGIALRIYRVRRDVE